MLTDVLKSFKKEIWLNYVLLIVEFVCASSMPWLLGKSIDSLIKNEYQMFGIYISCTMLNLFVGVTRRSLDTRIFAKIGNDLCLKTIEKLFEKNIDSNKISARINNVGKFTNFYEHFLPQLVKSTVQMVIAFCVLYSNVQNYSFLVCVIMGFTLISSYYVAQKTEVMMTKILHEEEERQHYLFEERSLEALQEKHYNIGELSIKKSDLDAINWGFFDICYYACEIMVLYMLIKNNHTVGEITSSLLYVNSFCSHFSMFAYAFSYFKDLKVAKDFLEEVD